MHRIPGTVAGSVAALAAVALLSACGGNDSTASQTPTLSTSAAAKSTTTPPVVIEPPAEAPSSTAPETSAPAEEPTPLPQTSAAAPATGKDKAFLDELAKNGITPGDQTTAITTATYICSTKGTGASDADVATFVAAMAGTDPSFDASKMDVNKAAQIYIAAANSTYC
ncbi:MULTISPECIES: DUF732 domain-containing protein [unclassified Nocardia]|uniref:DUF732 domain-containing protein n=1 Tax=unclassified Nocardia TaxID=2637762 RepID=UPI00364DEDAA